jgi:hypothetical protein
MDQKWKEGRLNEKQTWESMNVTFVGHLADLVRGGEGKLSGQVAGDTGEPTKKPIGSG